MILVTGNGRLAKELEKLSTDTLPIITLSRREMDITNEYMVSDVIKKFMIKPDFPKYLIHTAALTKPMDVNDRNPIMSMDTNVVGTANVAKVCSKYGIKFIYISTDFVYGDSSLVDENSEVKPSNNYGWSKLGGECSVKLYENSLILRIAMMNKPILYPKALTDVKRSLLFDEDAAKITLKLLDNFGTINVGYEPKSIYDFTKEHNPNVGKISLSEVGDIKLPSNTSVNVGKMKKLLKNKEKDL